MEFSLFRDDSFFSFFFEFDKTRKMQSLNLGFKGDGFVRKGKKILVTNISSWQMISPLLHNKNRYPWESEESEERREKKRKKFRNDIHLHKN